MPRKVQDIIPAEKRTIREVKALEKKPVISKRKKVVEEDGEEAVPLHKVRDSKIELEIKPKSKIEELSGVSISQAESVPQRRMPITPPSGEFERKKKNIWKWPVITVVAVLIVAIIGYFASVYYSHATFTVVPKVVPVTINNNFVAQYQTSDFPYDVITLKRSATSTIPATNGGVTNTKATGKVTFYNYYGSQSVRLIAGTRLTNKNGLLYRLNSTISIPGYTKSNGTVIPGKISATISADQSGFQYNISDSELEGDFKVVAYNNSTKYTTIYAKPTAPIVGGYSGIKKVIATSDMSSTTAKLKSELSATLLSDLKSSIPSGYIFYDKNYITTYSAPVVSGTDPKTANVGMEGVLTAIVFPKSKLVEGLAGGQAVSLFSPFNFTSPGLESLDITITNLKDFNLSKKTALVIKAKGEMKIVGTVPVDELKKKLSGSTLAESQNVFKSYSAVIESGSGELAPPWANIPSDLNKIKVVVEEP
jgi:hypothetical protein